MVYIVFVERSHKFEGASRLDWKFCGTFATRKKADAILMSMSRVYSFNSGFVIHLDEIESNKTNYVHDEWFREYIRYKKVIFAHAKEIAS